MFIHFLSIFSSLSYSDFSDPSTFLIYIYYNKPDLDCPLCTKFNNKISELNIPIKRLNFHSDPLISSHFYVYEFPSFIIRSKLRSYRVQAETVDDLFNIVNNEEWRNIKPMYRFLNPDTYFTKIYAFVYVKFYYVVEYLAEYIENIPLWVINGVMTFMISYLVMSIVGIFKSNKCTNI
ncbi:thioredoxin-related transmembrane protein [Vairimorpha necatrix]|uniref:Thioredoxin-related transmembrane protein n=1 Tax=Vairimorpha necatrix TaxID=6039 RepID=A0AAX4JGT6_9MICR